MNTVTDEPQPGCQCHPCTAGRRAALHADEIIPAPVAHAGKCGAPNGTFYCNLSAHHEGPHAEGIIQWRAAGPTTPAGSVDHPSHYKRGGVEAITVIEAWGLDFCLGNAVKYIARAGYKSADAREDLEKAIWYLNRKLNKGVGK